MPHPSNSGPKRSLHRAGPLATLALLSSIGLVPLGCGDEVSKNYITNVYGDAGDDGGGTTSGKGGSSGKGGESSADGGSGGDGVVVSPYPGAPIADTAVADLSPDVFGTIRNRYWFGVSDEQLEQLNERAGGGGFPGPGGEDLYQPGGSGDGNYVDHLWLTTPPPDGKTADYGKVQVKIVGQSTMRLWTPSTIPNLNVDFDEFVEDQRIGVYEHLRFNNAQVGSIFRERLTLQFFRALGYPAPRATNAWVSSNVWGADVAIPYVVVERYKPIFCKEWEDTIGGGCANIWEFVGDFGGGYGFPGEELGSVFDDPNICEFSECDNTRAKELEIAVRETPMGDGFKQALADWIHWPSFHQFQCLSWMLEVGDDALHNTNNVVLMERGDGLFQYLPYSVDISLGQDWYPDVPLPGMNVIARGCQSDATCWADMIATCEDLIDEFNALDPKAMLDAVYDELTTEGMIRSGDDGRYEGLSSYLDSRLEQLPVELEANREPPLICPPYMVDCGGYCDYYENCGNNCQPPPPPPIIEVGGAGGAGPAAGGAPGAGGDIGAGGGGGVVCQPIDNYPMK